MTLDLKRLDDITDGDVSLKKELLGMFFATFERCIAVMQSGNSDEKAWREAAHELKGAANTMGFEDLGLICREVERTPALPTSVQEHFCTKLTLALQEVTAYAKTLG
jgi:HPt (histidine-containing phosphotransfer) domain-containing protein